MFKLDRRYFVASSLAAVCGASCTDGVSWMRELTPVDSDFRFSLYSAPGSKALEAWEFLKRTHNDEKTPLVLGSFEDFEIFREGMDFGIQTAPQSIIDKGSVLKFPDALKAYRKENDLMVQEMLKNDPAFMNLHDRFSASTGLGPGKEQTGDLDIGEWPEEKFAKDEFPTLSVAKDWNTDKPYDTVLLTLIPTSDWTETPAYLNYGGWNDCPPPEVHISAFRSWKEQYGAELIGLSYDTMNIRINRKPDTRHAAIELAKIQYEYCGDIVEQGVGDVATLAKALMQADWWYFWWD